ncbi:MAG: hypothetical protein M3Z48_12520 [Lactobacillus sp.]|nr:hypothetical protein [Lactobacillus sp.]
MFRRETCTGRSCDSWKYDSRRDDLESRGISKYSSSLCGCRCKDNSATAPSAGDFYTILADLIVKVQSIFYSDPIDVVSKALGVS